jgi:glyoxalase family protein
MTIESETIATAKENRILASAGLHHVTAISRDIAANLRFYTEVLGLRLVKRTVNFDDPTAHHLYYGDEGGTPGSILTFFGWEGAHAGQLGLGQAVEIAFRIPRSSLGWWTQRLIEKGIAFDAPEKRFGETVLGLKDPDGIRLELVASQSGDAEGGWTSASVPAEHAIRGIHAVTLWLGEAAGTGALLEQAFGYERAGSEGSRTRYVSGGTGLAAIVDLRGRMGAGAVHHIAFRAADDAAQEEMVEKLASLGVPATEQKDRTYFRSVYFREPGGVIFEIATDGPGFTVDEPVEALGSALKLPPQYEPHRTEIEAALPKLDR